MTETNANANNSNTNTSNTNKNAATPPLPPTPPMPPKPPVNPIVETAGERRSRSRRVAFAAGAFAIVATTAVGAPAAVRAMSDDAASAAAPRTAQIQAGDPLTLDLGDVTLDELSAELADMGLELRIGSTSAMHSELDHNEEDRVANPDEGLDDEDATDRDEGDWDEGDWEDWDEDDWTDEDLEDGDHGDEDSGDHDHGEDEEPLGAFPIDGDSIDLSSASSPEVAEQAHEIWARFIELIPADERQMVTSFELVPEEFSGAYVYPADDPTKWVLGVGLGLGDDLDFVLIHEFAHLLSLKASEVPPTSNEANCDTYFTGEGCALSGSVMAEFVERFWPQSQIDLIRNATEAGDWDALDDFYSDNSEDFVTDYATTNPAEDVADTFATFVTEDQPDNLGSPDLTLAEQKVEYFWSIPEMVELRAEIRANL